MAPLAWLFPWLLAKSCVRWSCSSPSAVWLQAVALTLKLARASATGVPQWCCTVARVVKTRMTGRVDARKALCMQDACIARPEPALRPSPGAHSVCIALTLCFTLSSALAACLVSTDPAYLPVSVTHCLFVSRGATTFEGVVAALAESIHS